MPDLRESSLLYSRISSGIAVGLKQHLIVLDFSRYSNDLSAAGDEREAGLRVSIERNAQTRSLWRQRAAAVEAERVAIEFGMQRARIGRKFKNACIATRKADVNILHQTCSG